MYDQNPPPRLFQIPEEIVMDEILPRLPVKSLSRFKCVSKSWQSLIESDDRFIKIHYRNSAKNPRVIFSDLYSMKECSLQSLLNSKEGSDPTKKEASAGFLVGCCNGVVCCYDHGYGDRRFWLWNPAIRIRIELPDSGGYYIVKCGFGWDESSGAYKVFAVLSERKSNEKSGRVYSSNTKSWRTIPCGSLSVFVHRGVFLRGNLHWVVRHSLIEVECFDMEREEFGRIELPSDHAALMVSFSFPVLGEIGRNLSILIDWEESLEVWVMKEYGVKDSWFKLRMFPHTALSRPFTFACLPIFGEGPNGEIFVCHEKYLADSTPEGNAFFTYRNHADFIIARLYVESLVSPKRILNGCHHQH